jgi:carboxypeptidase D
MRYASLGLRLALATLPAALAVTGCGRVEPSRTAAVDAYPGVAYVRLPSRLVDKAFVDATGFDRDHKRDDTYAFGYLKHDAIAALPGDVQDQIQLLDGKALAHADFDAKTLAIKAPAENLKAAEGYHDFPALTNELQGLVAAHPDHASVESIGKSVQGRDLWLLKIASNVAEESNKPKLLYIANMHGDEVVGRELMIYLARRLLNDYGTDPRITKLVDAAQIYILPSMNPDGYELDQRYNADGVDLNRDFPDFTADPTDTPDGRAVETQAVMALHAKHHFLMAINFHGGDVCFNVPWDTKANNVAAQRFGDDALMQLAGRQYADANATMKANNGGSFHQGVTYGYEWYEVDGGMQDWSVYYRRSIHATVELSYTKWPSASALPGFWEENKEALLKYLEQGLYGVHLQVLDTARQPVQHATVHVSSANRDVAYDGAFIHRPTIGGEQTVHVTADGFKPKDVTLTPWSFEDGRFEEVQLERQ